MISSVFSYSSCLCRRSFVEGLGGGGGGGGSGAWAMKTRGDGIR